MNESVASACKQYWSYHERILRPAADSFRRLLDSGPVRLYEAFATNLFAAHAIDYLWAIRKADNVSSSRPELVRCLDEVFFVGGGRFQNWKFRLVDAVNNALKHVEIDHVRFKHYSDLVAKYGPVSFECLTEDDDRVICLLEGYRFDYSRVVLRPVLDSLVDWHFDDLADILELARGSSSDVVDWGDVVGYDDPIDQMIEYCNPVCEDCGEGESDCVCAEYVYDGASGEFAPIRDDTFDFEQVMSRISGAYGRGG